MAAGFASRHCQGRRAPVAVASQPVVARLTIARLQAPPSCRAINRADEHCCQAVQSRELGGRIAAFGRALAPRIVGWWHRHHSFLDHLGLDAGPVRSRVPHLLERTHERFTGTTAAAANSGSQPDEDNHDRSEETRDGQDRQEFAHEPEAYPPAGVARTSSYGSCARRDVAGAGPAPPRDTAHIERPADPRAEPGCSRRRPGTHRPSGWRRIADARWQPRSPGPSGVPAAPRRPRP